MSPSIGTNSIKTTQAMIVWLFLRASLRDRIGQLNAPAMPDVVAVMDRMAMETVLRCSSVLANRIAVADTVAMASERRNQPIRNMTTCRNLVAATMVFHKETQAKERYPQ